MSEQFTLPFGNMQPFSSVYGGENPYQNPTLSNPSKKRFTSYDRSETTGLDYAVNRFYSPQQGRFTQVDPIEMDATDLEDPQSLNLYSYCGNDPINHVDPEGLFFGKIWRAIKGFFSSTIGKIVVAVALIVLTAGLLGPLAAQTVVGSFSIGGGATAAVVGATHLTALGWATVGLAALSGVSLPSGFGGYGGFRTPPINPGAVEQYVVPQRGRRGGDRRQNPPRLQPWRNLPRRGGREARRAEAQLSTTDPGFPDLARHVREHGGGMSRTEYFAAARDHVKSHMRNPLKTQRFRVFHDGQWKWNYVTRVGPDNFIFTSTTLNGRNILTHMRDSILGGKDKIHTQYLRNKGIRLPDGF